MTLSWDLDGDGTFETTDTSPSFVGVDGPSTSTIAVQACDPDGPCSVASAPVDVLNVAPMIDSVEAGVGGTEATVTVAFSDVGLADTHTVTVDWGDSSPPASVGTDTSGGQTVVFAHEYGPRLEPTTVPSRSTTTAAPQPRRSRS